MLYCTAYDRCLCCLESDQINNASLKLLSRKTSPFSSKRIANDAIFDIIQANLSQTVIEDFSQYSGAHLNGELLIQENSKLLFMVPV